MEGKKENNKLLITAGIIMICVVLPLFQRLSEFELSGDSAKLYPIFIALNKILGKYAACGILLLLGGFLVVLGKRKESKLELIEEEENAPEFVAFGDEKFELIRTWSDEEIHYFIRLNLEIKEGQVYKHFWEDDLNFEDENDENWLNISRYFWKTNEPFYNTFLPEDFKNFQQLKFRFKNADTAGNIRTEMLAGVIEKFHFEVENRVIPINELVERGLIEYFKIEDLITTSLQELKFYEDELFLSIANPKIKCRNNQLYIGQDKISLEIGYAIGAVELTRVLPAKELKPKFESKILSEDSKVLHSTPKDSEFGINKKRTVEATLVGNIIITEERTLTTYENYVPDIKGKELYFQTLILLMNFIQQNDKSIDIAKNKFYVLALENTIEMPALDGNLEELIFEYAEKCKQEFTGVEIGYLFRNSLNVLKGKFAIHPNIPKLYYRLFDFFDFRTSGHENYFYGLWE